VLVKVATETTECKGIEQQRKGKRKRVEWKTRTTEDTNNDAKTSIEKLLRMQTAQRRHPPLMDPWTNT
jgi:hypothetical protein